MAINNTTNADKTYDGEEKKFINSIALLLEKIKASTVGRETNGEIYYTLDNAKFEPYFKELSDTIRLNQHLWFGYLKLLKVALLKTASWQPIAGFYADQFKDVLKNNNLQIENIFSDATPRTYLLMAYFENTKELNPIENLKHTNGQKVELYEQILNAKSYLLSIWPGHQKKLMNKAYSDKSLREYLIANKDGSIYKMVADLCYTYFNNSEADNDFKAFMLEFAEMLRPEGRDKLDEAVKANLISWHMDLEQVSQSKLGQPSLASNFEIENSRTNGGKFSNVVFKNLLFSEGTILKFLETFLEAEKKETYSIIIKKKKINSILGWNEMSEDERAEKLLSCKMGATNMAELEKMVASYPNSNHNALVAQDVFNYCWEMGHYASCAYITSVVEDINLDFSFDNYTKGLLNLGVDGGKGFNSYFYEYINKLAKVSNGRLMWEGYAKVLDDVFDKCVNKRWKIETQRWEKSERASTKIDNRFHLICQSKLDEIFQARECKTILPLIVCLFASQGEHLNNLMLHSTPGQYGEAELKRAYEAIGEIVEIAEYPLIEKTFLEALIQLTPEQKLKNSPSIKI